LALHQRRATILEQRPGATGREDGEREAIGDLLEAVFDSDASHGRRSMRGGAGERKPPARGSAVREAPRTTRRATRRTRSPARSRQPRGYSPAAPTSHLDEQLLTAVAQLEAVVHPADEAPRVLGAKPEGLGQRQQRGDLAVDQL